MRFKESIIIAASPDHVWKYVGSPECWSQFDDKVDQCEPVSGQKGHVGSVYKAIRRMGKKTIPTHCEIIDMQTGRIILVQETTADPNQPESSAIFTYELKNLGSSTKVTVRAEISYPRMNFLLKALVWFVFRFGSPQGETPLMKLKRIVEADELTVKIP